ncbi:MAG TPA: flagellar basal-body MS-ring/collar protein FliF [Parvularculaceae bacterium]|nr:flagellar basal-body MS-ring/collar protein FliF [Parvularculaceae bacterium]
MQGLISVWRIMTPAKRIMLIGAVAATIALFSVLARTASTPNMALLFAGLDGRTSGDVVAALARLNIPYDIRGDAIYVPSARRDAVRMQLAGQGLPEQGQAGYELLDKLNGFATTSDMFDATYWRAKEGELARTILATPGVKMARVHIATPKEGAFTRNAPPPTGVVTVTMGASPLEPSQAKAIRFLVSSAVPGLKPEEVAVIDAARGVVLSPGSDTDELGAAGDADSRQAKIEKNILDLLEARVGAGNARVKVALDLDMERQAVTEHTFNPDSHVISQKETTESSDTASGQGGSGGAVTVASNLPEGDAGAAGGGSNSQRTETKETIKYDTSDVKREVEKLPGAIKRMSIAVFVNQIAQAPTEDGGDPVMRTPEELQTLKNLVADAAGLDEKRGDTLTIEALPFKDASSEGAVAKADPMGDFMRAHLMDAIKIVFLGLVTLILGLFVVKPLFSGKNAAPLALAPAGSAPTPTVQAGAIAAMPEYRELAPLSAPEPDAIEVLKQIAASNTDETAALIKSWLETAEDAA